MHQALHVQAGSREGPHRKGLNIGSYPNKALNPQFESLIYRSHGDNFTIIQGSPSLY